MFNPMAKDDDSYPQRLLLASLPIVLVALIPATVTVWKEVRASRKAAAEKAEKAKEVK